MRLEYPGGGSIGAFQIFRKEKKAAKAWEEIRRVCRRLARKG
jgi:hypothetical protein